MEIILSNAHTSYAKGASSTFNGRLYTEYDLSVQINKELYALLNDTYSTLIIDGSTILPYNKSLTYKASMINENTPKVAIETHFNAGLNATLAKFSSGMEVVYTDRNNDKCKVLAQSCIQSMCNYLPFKIRRNGTGLYKNDKIYMLNTTLYPTIIIETCFITHPIDRLFLLHPRAINIIATSLYKGITTFIQQGG